MATKNTTPHSAEPIETALLFGADAVKNGFEKATVSYDQMVSFGKGNAEAVLKSVNEVSKSIETINTEVLTFTRKSVESGMSIAKAVFAAKTVEEAFQLQSQFGKQIFDSYVDQMAKFGDMTRAATKVAVEPIQARTSAFADMVRAA